MTNVGLIKMIESWIEMIYYSQNTLVNVETYWNEKFNKSKNYWKIIEEYSISLIILNILVFQSHSFYK